MPDFLILAVMTAVFAFLSMICKWPIGLSLAASALCGALIGGKGLAVRHLAEGTFGYFDTILIIACAMIFMKIMQQSGLLDNMTVALLKIFHRRKASLLLTVMLIIMFPGMITGSSTVAVLSTGALVVPVLMKLGLSRVKTAALIAMGAILGMIAPPVNILVMIMGGGVDMPYTGVTLPLLILVIPLAVIISFWLGWRDLKPISFRTMQTILPRVEPHHSVFILYLPLGLVLLLMAAESLPYPFLPRLGMPAIFILGSIAGLFCGKRFHFLQAVQAAIKDSLPILAILAGVGMFIQIMTLTGGRGWVIMSFLSLPAAFLYFGIAVSMPLFGAVSAYGSASILGVPFILALINKNALITASALSAVAGLGDLMPPTALAGIFAAQVAEEDNYFNVLRRCLIPALFILLAGMGMLLASSWLDKII
jgi:TRAP-type C4-dicarboxylate transport system permease large subunit